MPLGSLDGDQVRSISVDERALAMRFSGGAGGMMSPGPGPGPTLSVVALTTSECADSFGGSALSTAVSVYWYAVFAVSPVSRYSRSVVVATGVAPPLRYTRYSWIPLWSALASQ